ncbi:GxxExxY protein [Candidatus Woesebacteria bacterium]|nr:GxxExxY protein [Candidatus Woesebacteria bacterium]
MPPKVDSLIYPKISYLILGICFSVQNELGIYAKEKQYSDLLEKRFRESKISYKRQFLISDSGNIVDFIIDNKIILEVKAKRIITKSDYYQLQRYLQESKIKLGLLVNFRNKYLKPKRVIRIDKK